MFFLELIAVKRILRDPFVSLTIENEVLETAQQIDSPVVLAPVAGLQIGVEAVDVLVIHCRQQYILFSANFLGIGSQIAEYPVILVRGQLGDAYSDLGLPLLAILTQFGKEHQRRVFRLGKPLLDLNGVPLVTLLDQLLPDLEHSRPKIVETGIYLTRQPVVTRRPLFGLIPLRGADMALNVNLALKPVRRNPRQNRREAVFASPALAQQEQDSKSFSFHSFPLF